MEIFTISKIFCQFANKLCEIQKTVQVFFLKLTLCYGIVLLSILLYIDQVMIKSVIHQLQI